MHRVELKLEKRELQMTTWSVLKKSSSAQPLYKVMP